MLSAHTVSCFLIESGGVSVWTEIKPQKEIILQHFDIVAEQ